MSATTGISWTDKTWNPLLGCDRVSEGCDNCYAIVTATIRAGNPHPAVAAAFAGLTDRRNGRLDWTGQINLLPGRLYQPLSWRKPARIFVNSQADLFHKAVPDEYIAQVFAVMARAERHTFQILTKRHARMRALLRSDRFREMVVNLVDLHDHQAAARLVGLWPLPNVWVGVSVEDQRWADIRLPALAETPAAVRWISAEPLLGPLNIRRWSDSLDWVVCGGESGARARPACPSWFANLRNECVRAGIAFHMKQWGCWRPDPTAAQVSIVDTGGHEYIARMRRMSPKAAGRELDGEVWDQYPTPAEPA